MYFVIWKPKDEFTSFTNVLFATEKEAKEFAKKSINNGHPICYKQTWNTKCQTKYMSIDRLSDLIGNCFG